MIEKIKVLEITEINKFGREMKTQFLTIDDLRKYNSVIDYIEKEVEIITEDKKENE